MAIDPYVIDSSGGSPSYSGQEFRLAAGAAFMHGTNALGARSGILPNSGLTALGTTAQGTPNMTVNVAVGQAVVQGSTTTTQGPYIYTLDTAKTVTITAAHATLPRIDVIAVRIRDSNVSGTGLDGDVVAIAGTAASSPAVPGFPADGASYLALSQISVPAAATTIATGQITNYWTWTTAAGGKLLFETRAKRDAAVAFPPGVESHIWTEDTDGTLVDGAWVDNFGPIQSYTPTWTASTTNPAIGNGSITGRYKRYRDLVYVEMTVTMGSTTTYGSGGYRLSVPAGLTPTGRPLLNGTLRTTSTYRLCMDWDTSLGVFLLRQDPAAAQGALAVFAQGSPITLASTHVVYFNGWYSL
jgi:hypothetical protein